MTNPGTSSTGSRCRTRRLGVVVAAVASPGIAVERPRQRDLYGYREDPVEQERMPHAQHAHGRARQQRSE